MYSAFSPCREKFNTRKLHNEDVKKKVARYEDFPTKPSILICATAGLNKTYSDISNKIFQPSSTGNVSFFK